MQLEARLRAFAAIARLRVVVAGGGRAPREPARRVQAPRAARGRGGPGARDARARGRTLTPAGEVLADFVLRAEALLANAARALATERPSPACCRRRLGHARDLPAAGAVRRLPRAPSCRRDPAAADDSAGAVELVRSHRVELAVVGAATATAEPEAEPLIGDDIVLVGPPAFGGRRLRPRDLAGLPWISLGGLGDARRRRRSASRAHIHEPRRSNSSPRRRSSAPSPKARGSPRSAGSRSTPSSSPADSRSSMCPAGGSRAPSRSCVPAVSR